MKSFKHSILLVAVVHIITMSTNYAYASQRGFTSIVEGSGQVISERKELPAIHHLTISGGAHLDLYQANQSRLIIEVENNIRPVLDIKVEDNQLILGQKHASIEPKHPIRYKLYTPNLYSLTVMGAAKVQARDGVKFDQIQVNVSGGGQANLRLMGNKLRANLTGAGQLIADGEVAEQKVKISGSGKYHGSLLKGTLGLVNISGSGLSHVNISEDLDVRISGSGRLFYAGHPEIKQTVWDNGLVLSEKT